MGGDASPGEIEAMAKWVKAQFPHLKTAWYSGKEAVPEGFDIKSLDYIKLGPYIEALGGLKSPATNQAIYRIYMDGKMEKCSLN